MNQPLHIAFIWHMHQPYYRDLATGECSMPWVRLHGTKDYLDMVKILEAYPSVHQTFNLVPSLMDQLEEYLRPSSRSDRFLDVSRKRAADLSDSDKRFVLEQFFMANWEHMVKPFPRYHDLLAKRGWQVGESQWADVIKRFKPQDYLDVQVWFNLTWIDPWLRQQDPELTRLVAKGANFTEAEKTLVLDKQLELLGQIVPAYQAAEARGQVELSTTPYYHPIVPLLCDLRSANMALPHMIIPSVTFRHPEDATWHLSHGLARHEQIFGRRPRGLWPSEGSVSDELVRLAIEQGLQWIATDEEILWRTLRTAPNPALRYRPHAVNRDGRSLAVGFRDRELSDLLGFVYRRWDASAAVRDLLGRLDAIREGWADPSRPPLVTIILDGENAWESYPRDGQDFFHGLYRALSGDARFRLVTVSEFLAQWPADMQAALPTLFAGSWIDGNFATWIGHPEKNTAWTHLASVREDLVAMDAAEQASEAGARAWRSFYVAEGSDWTWWLGDTHSSEQDEEFDRLFRTHLINSYRLRGKDAPAWLDVPIKTRAVEPLYEPTAWITPIIDGVETTYYEWLYAGHVDLRKGYSAAHRGQQVIVSLRYGFDQEHGYFRIDVDPSILSQHARWTIRLDLARQRAVVIEPVNGGGVMARLHGAEEEALPCAFVRTIELAVPRSQLSVQAESLHMALSFSAGDQLLESYPPQGTFRLPVPVEDLESRMWFV